MEDIIRSLYYILDDWVGQQYQDSEEAKELLARREALKEQLILRLGDDGQEAMEALSNLNLELEDIHGQALLCAAMQLGAQIARPGAVWEPHAAPVTNPRAAASPTVYGCREGADRRAAHSAVREQSGPVWAGK